MNPFKRHPRYGAADAPLPHWYGVTAAVLAAFWSYTGFQAHQNTPGDEGEGV